MLCVPAGEMTPVATVDWTGTPAIVALAVASPAPDDLGVAALVLARVAPAVWIAVLSGREVQTASTVGDSQQAGSHQDSKMIASHVNGF